MPAKMRRFTVILEPEPDGGYSVHCPALPGCVSQGDDRKSALANIEEAIILVLEEFDDKVSSALAAATLETSNGVPFPPMNLQTFYWMELGKSYRRREKTESR